MTEHPYKHFEAFAKAGADSVTVHYEVVGNQLPPWRRRRASSGWGSAWPSTPEHPGGGGRHRGGADLVLCMGIHPGYSGQPYMPETGQVQRLRELLHRRCRSRSTAASGSRTFRA